MEGLRRTFGIAEPVRRGMELKIAREGEWRAQALGGSAGVSGDVLEGRDISVEWEDIFAGMFRLSLPRSRGRSTMESGRMDKSALGMWADLCCTAGDETREAVDFHSEMEARLKMDW